MSAGDHWPQYVYFVFKNTAVFDGLTLFMLQDVTVESIFYQNNS
jgi:hypothetical protein